MQAIYVNPFSNFLAGQQQRRQDDRETLQFLQELRLADQRFRRDQQLNPIQIEQARFNLEVDQQFTPDERANQIRNLVARTGNVVSQTAARDRLLPGQVIDQELSNLTSLQNLDFNARANPFRLDALGLGNQRTALGNAGLALDNRFAGASFDTRLGQLGANLAGTRLDNVAQGLQNDFNLFTFGTRASQLGANLDSTIAGTAGTRARTTGTNIANFVAGGTAQARAPFFGDLAQAEVNSATGAGLRALAQGTIAESTVQGQVGANRARLTGEAPFVYGGRTGVDAAIAFGQDRVRQGDILRSRQFRDLVNSRNDFSAADKQRIFDSIPGLEQTANTDRGFRVIGDLFRARRNDISRNERVRVPGLFNDTRRTVPVGVGTRLTPNPLTQIPNALQNEQLLGTRDFLQGLQATGEIQALIAAAEAGDPQALDTLTQLQNLNAATGPR